MAGGESAPSVPPMALTDVPTIIAAYDGSAASRAAVQFAVALAHAQDAAVSAVHVYPRAAPAGLRGAVYDKQLQEGLHDEGKKVLEGLDVEGVAHRVLVSGSPAQALHELAEEEHAAFIVVGSTHRGHLGRVVPGSVGAKLLHGAPCAVCVVPPEEPRPIRTILAAYDEGPQARAALREAERLARALGATLEIMAVQQPHVHAGHRGVATTELDYVLLEGMQARVRAEADAMAGVEVEARSVIGDAAESLTEAAQGADLVVAGSRGYGPLHSVLVGGVSRHLVDHARCPVVVVPRTAERAEAVASADVSVGSA
jgi:nucleotide-binding universal stress UspA family protein